jgi:outer membrane receptor protein involved in Fe transport
MTTHGEWGHSMNDHRFRTALLGLLASTALATPAVAQDTAAQPTGPGPTEAPRVTVPESDQDSIIITATKREENLQNVPISVQLLGTKKLDQLNISNFEQYTKQLPSVSFQNFGVPGATVVYMRGVATGGDGNHSGSLPSVGSYLDEQPITTIGGTLDVHIYDIARIESLAGPQGTLYGASSEAGTIRIITNKPELGVTTGRVDGELNMVDHGDMGGKLEGMVNLSVATRIAFRAAAFWQRDAGFIDNIHGSRTYYAFPDDFTGPTADFPDAPPAADVPTITVDNSGLEKKNKNDVTTYGGRAALKVDLTDNWTATPTFMYQNMKANGVSFFDPNLGNLKIDRFRDDVRKDKFWQAAMTIQGKVANFDVTYAGAYMDRKTYTLSDYADYADAYDFLYADYYGGAYGRGLSYFSYLDSAGNRTVNPQQFIIGTDHFKKMSQEVRIASPADKPFRVIAGAFYQRQSNLIHQDYRIDDLGPQVSVNGLPGTLWLTQQHRVDKDYALFGEASFDVTPHVTLTAGGRWYKFDNSLLGFFGFGRNPGGNFTDKPFNAGNSSRTGVAGCFLNNGETLREAYLAGEDIGAIGFAPTEVAGGPCTNLGVFADGKVHPKRVKDSGFIHRLNATWRPKDGLMFYATWSRGFRPGGINRRGDVPPYAADFLSNYEVGWKTSFGALRWNGAVYHQRWKKFQFSFLGENSFTEIHNGKDANINGVETDINYASGGLSLTAAAAYTDAKTKGNVCNAPIETDPSPDCSGVDAAGDPDFISIPSKSRLPVTPKFKATATARYSWRAWNDVKAHVQAGVAYKDSARSEIRSLTTLSGLNDDCTPLGFATCNPNLWLGRIKSSTVFDLYAGLDWPKWNIEAFVTNVTDSGDEQSRLVNCGSCTRVLVVPGRPRTIGIRAGMKF